MTSPTAGLDRPELELLLWMRSHAGSHTARDVVLVWTRDEGAVTMMLCRLAAAGLVERAVRLYDRALRWRAVDQRTALSPREFGRLLLRDPVAAYLVMAGRWL